MRRRSTSRPRPAGPLRAGVPIPLAIAVALALGPAGIHAQERPPGPPSGPAPRDPTAPPKPDDGRPDGWRFSPALTVGAGYDSNLYATPAFQEGDAFLVVTPSLTLERSGRRTDLTLAASLADTRYRDHGNEDSTDYRLSATGNVRLSAIARVFGGASVSRQHEDRTSPDDVFGVEPTRYDERNAHFGYVRRGPVGSFRVGGTVQQLRFEDVRDPTGALLINRDRDRDVSGLGFRMGLALSPVTDLFVQGTFDRRDYRLPLDDAGFERGSSGWVGVVGLAFRPPARVQGEVYVGRMWQRYDDAALDDVDVPAFGAVLEGRLASGTQLAVSLERALYETTAPDASGYLDTSLSLRASRRFDARLSARAALTAARSDFRGTGRTDDLLVPSVGLTYRLGRTTWLDADYRLMQRRSDVADAEYDRHVFSLSVRYEAAGAASAAAFAETEAAAVAAGDAPPADGPSGVYAGVALGHDVLSTRVSGTRGGEHEPGDYLAGFSGDGNAAGVFLGYGHSFGRWHVAGELDATRSGAGWRHDKAPESRAFSSDAGDERGLTLLIGRVLPSGALADVSVGRRRARFDSRYVTEDGLASDHRDDEFATHFGVGLDVSLGGRLFARARYEIAHYDGYPVVYEAPEADRFSGSLGRFQLGLGWRFGAAAVAPAGIRLPGGFHAGVQGGDDRGWSSTDAIMRQGSQPAETTFDADFGGRGRDFGAFAGYGWTPGRFYAGLEAEFDSSTASWQHARLPQGRRFSVDFRSSDGVALRLGHVTRGGALLYLRGGVVRSRFRVLYEKGANPDAWLDRDETLSGTRVGVGIEAPLTRQLFLRLDYTSTAYEDIRFTTAHQRADDIRYRNRQHLARVGLGIRF